MPLFFGGAQGPLGGGGVLGALSLVSVFVLLLCVCVCVLLVCVVLYVFRFVGFPLFHVEGSGAIGLLPQSPRPRTSKQPLLRRGWRPAATLTYPSRRAGFQLACVSSLTLKEFASLFHASGMKTT